MGNSKETYEKRKKIGYGLFVGKKMKNHVRTLSNDSK